VMVERAAWLPCSPYDLDQTDGSKVGKPDACGLTTHMRRRLYLVSNLEG
jgi:hypothetical protein